LEGETACRESPVFLEVEEASFPSAEFVNNVLRLWRSPAFFEDQAIGLDVGQAFVGAGREFDIDPAIALAFFRRESGFGVCGGNPNCVSRKAKAIGNIRYVGQEDCTAEPPFVQNRSGEKFCAYASWSDGVKHFFKLLDGPVYRKRGLNALDEIVPVFAPPEENNTEKYLQEVKEWSCRFKALAKKKNALEEEVETVSV
jgi:hypothetical protein